MNSKPPNQFDSIFLPLFVFPISLSLLRTSKLHSNSTSIIDIYCEATKPFKIWVTSNLNKHCNYFINESLDTT
jgi:hypothetical protein